MLLQCPVCAVSRSVALCQCCVTFTLRLSIDSLLSVPCSVWRLAAAQAGADPAQHCYGASGWRLDGT